MLTSLCFGLPSCSVKAESTLHMGRLMRTNNSLHNYVKTTAQIRCAVIAQHISAFVFACADPEIFMRGGPTKMVIFGHRRGGGGGSNPPKIPKLLFLSKNFQIPGEEGSGPPVPPSGSAHVSLHI